MNTSLILDYVLYFFFYSALGWFVESIYCSIPAKKWVNRGFLRGPICPIYGTGAVIFAVCLSPFKDKWYLVLLIGMVLADLVEFVTSVLMEKLFHARWWDYSDKPFNIQGRICLGHTIYWGIASIVFMYIVHPFFENMFQFIPELYRNVSVGIMFFIFIADLINAIRTALDIRKLMLKIHKLHDTIFTTVDVLRNNVENKLNDLQQSIAKKGMKFAVFTIDLNRQLFETKKQFDKLQKDTKKDRLKTERMLNSSSFLKETAKARLDNIEQLIDELKNRITDDDSEMY